MKLDSSHDITPGKLPPALLKRILQNPNLLEQLSDRVYQLLQDDLDRQRERNKGYGRRF